MNKKCKTHANIRNNYFCTLFVFSSSNQNSMSASKRILSACLISALLLFCGQAFAQKSHKKKKKEPDFVSNLWYGGGLLLGFNGINNASIFSLGVSPMVGYKITPAISVGPRVEFILSSYKQIGYQATSLYDFDAGLFARGKVFRGLFIQGEVSHEWYQDIDFSQNKYTIQRFNQRIGGGWNWSNGRAGSEIGIFYNLAIANDFNSYQNPLSYRFGFTWNF